MGGTWLRCHAKAAGVFRSSISAGYQNNFVQSSELADVSQSQGGCILCYSRELGNWRKPQAPGRPPQCVVVVAYSCALQQTTAVWSLQQRHPQNQPRCLHLAPVPALHAGWTRGITHTAHFSSSKHHPVGLSEGAPPLILRTGWHQGAVSHTVVDALMLKAHFWFYNRRI